ncbi:MAG: phosphonate ABC transporter, permease protein PhnE [Chloroflexi bacterium]|nr:phosphonate ABC transporter, permease protein PhnE [Chloroflexota bacterium]
MRASLTPTETRPDHTTTREVVPSAAVAPLPTAPGFPERRSTLLNLLVVAGVIGAIWWSAAGTQFSLSAPFTPENTKSVARFVAGAFPPNLTPPFLLTVVRLVVETVQISIVGTALAIVLAFPLSALAMCRTGEELSRPVSGGVRWTARWAAYSASRTVLNLLRAVPELVWALIFVVAVGLGPYPGVLALAAHSTGVLGKLYAELFESVDPRLVEAGRVTGASELAVLLFVRVPATLPVLLSYSLFRWECNMRAATVLGFVGAGGVGTQLAISMKLFEYDSVLTLVLVLLALVVLVDFAGQLIRARVLAPTGGAHQAGAAADDPFCRPCEMG